MKSAMLSQRIASLLTKPGVDDRSNNLNFRIFDPDIVSPHTSDLGPPNKDIEEEGRTLGLTESQVNSPNFTSHKLYAIAQIQQRTKDLSSSDAYEMVRGKSPKDTQEFVESYMQATQKAQKPLDEMNLIRVVVNR